MDVTIKTTTSNEFGDKTEVGVEYSSGETTLGFHNGESEDNNLCRNFNDCWHIMSLVKKAHAAGKAGEPLNILEEERDIWD